MHRSANPFTEEVSAARDRRTASVQGASFVASEGSARRPPAVSSGARGDQWDYIFRLVHSEYAYCAMYGVNIVDGSIVACDNIQRSLTFGPSPVVTDESPSFDEYWRALHELCARIRNGRLAELKFVRGRPVSAKTAEGGRRFKRHLMKTAE